MTDKDVKAAGDDLVRPSEALASALQAQFAGVTETVNKCLAYAAVLERDLAAKDTECKRLHAELEAIKKGG